MNIHGIISADYCKPRPSFKASYVTLSQKNLGDKIAKDVVDSFNKKIFPFLRPAIAEEAQTVIDRAGVGNIISKPEDFKTNVDFFALAAGAGTRFKELAQNVGDYNKISLPFRIDNGAPLHMLDFAMAMGKYFIDDNGVNKIIAPVATGSFGDIVEHFKHNQIKDIVVCCGDNVFADKTSEMMPFFTRIINNPDKHIGLVGVKRTPEEVAKKFGVLGIEPDTENNIIKLTGFEEKPEIEVAQKMAVYGYNYANTGMFTLSKAVMEKIMDEINNGVNNIYKRENNQPKYKMNENGEQVLAEPYDFAEAVKYAHKMLPKWFDIDSKEGSEVLMVEKWEDVGDPQALYQFADDVKNGLYLGNFPHNLAEKIKSSFKKRVHLGSENEYPYINFSEKLQITTKQIAKAKNVEGVNIIV